MSLQIIEKVEGNKKGQRPAQNIRKEQSDKAMKIISNVLSNEPAERDALIMAVQKAFEVLENRESGLELISRRQAKSKKVYSHEFHEYVVPVCELDQLPAMRIEDSTGYWMNAEPMNQLDPKVQCSECGSIEILYKANFCPNCGAKMKGMKES